ncbi:hypothetical protein D3C71_990060 [compost metagenome]
MRSSITVVCLKDDILINRGIIPVSFLVSHSLKKVFWSSVDFPIPGFPSMTILSDFSRRLTSVNLLLASSRNEN